jgi:tryptophanyl-tRNA synthetase
VELTREIARRFNHLYGEVFPIPDVILTPTSKILGMDRRKMSKSYGNAIFLSDTDQAIDQKVSQMITDPQRMRRADPGNPDICNVYSFHEIYTDPETVARIDRQCRTAEIGCVECKKIMAEGLKKALDPIREKRRALESDMERLRAIVRDGNERARSIARQTMAEVREAVKI